MNPVLRLIIRDLRATADRSLVTIQIAFPVLLLFVSGFAYGGIIPPFQIGGKVISYPSFLAAGAIELSIMFGSLVAGSLVWVDKRLHMFEQILVGPFTRGQYILGKVISSMLVGMGGALVVSVFSAPVLNGIQISLYSPFVIAGSIVLSAFLLGSFAIFISTYVKSEQLFNALFNLIIFVLMFASSIYYPAEAAPAVLRALFLLNPLTYSVDLLRFGLFGIWSSTLPFEVAVLVVEGIIVFTAAALRFRKMEV